MKRPWYPMPMCVSIFLPGVGQFAKGDVTRALLIWGGLWTLLIVLVAFPPDTLRALVGMFGATAIGWMANVIDALVHVPRHERAKVRIMLDPERRHARPTMR